MGMHTTRLTGRHEVAQGTLAFELEKPAGFTFRPGQAFDIALPGLPGTGPDSRHTFSIVSAPHEERLAFATRMRDSAYKRALAALALGSPLEIDGPFGTLTLHGTRPGVLIAGGIGITPFMSMLRDAAHRQDTRPLALLYSNRRPEEAAFWPELQALARRLPALRLVATMTGMAQSAIPWDGPTGRIDAALVQRAGQGLAAPVYYVSGPPAMVRAQQETLRAAGVDEDAVRSEEFYGY